MRRFVVLSTQRSGSTLLTSSLNSHPDVLCSGELFFPRSDTEFAMRAYRRLSLRNWLMHSFRRGALVREYLDDYYSQPGYRATGFKFMYSQSRWLPYLYPSVVRYLHDHNIHVIHNIRENYLRMYISMLFTRTTGVYRSNTELKREPISINTRILLPNLRKLVGRDITWAERFSGHPYLKITYESFVNDQQSERSRIQSFLEIREVGELSSDFRKVTQSDLKKLIVNYEDVERSLMSTEFAYCLESF